MHADKTNRTALIVVGLILVLGGVAGALLGYGAVGAERAASTVLDNPVARFVGDYGAWIWPLAAFVGVLAALFGLRWLYQIGFSTDRAGEVAVPEDAAGGRTTLSSGALTRAVTEELEGYRGVSAASARMLGDPDTPHLVLGVVAEDSADLAEIRRRVQTDAIAHCRQALGRPALPITVDLGVGSTRASRVG